MKHGKIRRYVLDARGEPRPEPNFTVWVHWCATHSVVIAGEIVEGRESIYEVLTCFLTYDRTAENAVPLLFETSIVPHRGAFIGAGHVLYANRGEAIVGHHDAIFFVKQVQFEREGSV